MAFTPVTASTRSVSGRAPSAVVGEVTSVAMGPSAPGAPSEEFAWVGEGVQPNDAETARALDVLAAVPVAAAVGWTVRGQRWSTHGRRIRTAVVQPRPDWDIRCMRGVREVDSLSGRILVRRRHLSGLSLPSNTVGSAPNTVARSLRAAGFHLLLITAR